MLYLDIKFLRLISSNFRNFKQKTNKLFNCSCYLCGDSKNNSSKARGYFYVRANQLFYRCFNCNASTTFAKVLQDINPDLYKEYLLEKFQNNHSQNIKPIPLLKFGKLTKRKTYDNCEWCNYLPKDHSAIQYLKSRKIPESAYPLLGFTDNFQAFSKEVIPDLDKVIYKEPRLIIPYYNRFNELLGISGRAIEYNILRYITLRIDDNKLIYGEERLNRKKLVYIVEGQLDSLFIENCLAAGNADLISVAEDLELDKPILVWDNEKRNPNIVRNMERALRQNYSVVIWPDFWIYKDINEAAIAQENFMDIIENNIYSGIAGSLRLNYWKKI